MARTNAPRASSAPRTHEGARAKRISAEQQLRRTLMSCLLFEDNFYESGESVASRLLDCASKCSPEFVAQCAIEARKQHGLRHAPLYLCLDLLRRGGNHAGNTLAEVITRADELSEIFAMYRSVNGADAKFSAQLKRGVALAFPKFGRDRLAKYQAKDKSFTLRDAMFLSHPKPKDEAQVQVFKDLAANNLAPPDTWEVALSAGADKKETFERLLDEKKLGDLAFLRNLRNMALAKVDRRKILDSFRERTFWGVLPFQFLSAARAEPSYMEALDAAMRASLRHEREANPLRGTTHVVVDVSASMNAMLSGRGTVSRRDAAVALAILCQGICEDSRIYAFGSRTTEVGSYPGMGLDLWFRELGTKLGYDTRLGEAIRFVDSRYSSDDRIIVITDEQSRDSVPDPRAKNVYLMNVAPYRNGVGYHGKWVHIDGFSAQAVRFIHEYEAST